MVDGKPAGQFMAIHFRHIDVGQHCVERLNATEGQGIKGGGRGHDFISGPHEAAGKKSPELVLVIDDQNTRQGLGYLINISVAFPHSGGNAN